MADRWSVRRRSPPPRSAPAERDGGIRIGDIIARYPGTLGLEQRTVGPDIEREWAAAVGPAVAAHTRPGRLDRDQLVVFVDSSPWLSELQRFAVAELLEKVQARFGRERIRRVRLQLDPEPPPARRA
jgi:hypothetical protein